MKHNAVKSLALGVALAGFTTAAVAHDMPEKYVYLGGHVSEYWFDSNEKIHDAYDHRTLPGVQLGWRWARNWSAQAWWERNQARNELTGDRSYIDLGVASVRYHFADSSFLGFEPYLGLTAGQLRFDHGRRADDDKEWVAGIEAGLQARLATHFALDLGVRPVWAETDDRFEGEAYAALNILFGPQEQAEEIVELPAEPVVLDDDNDGVPNDRDQCPNTPAGVAVDANGCPLDSDGDGVPDYLDQCPNTPAGALVDDKGCPKFLESDITETLYVEFGHDRAEVRPEYMSELERAADWIRKYPNSSVRIEGHTDSTGPAAYNQKLSEQRAEAVRNALVSQFGVDASRLRVVGYGEDRPIADNSTAQGRAKNRRVETVIEATVREALTK